ncbi:hypothetical protein PHET_01457 [Paragonimus heterotremus]|uniref:PHD-type domain-containing protein n=1 Tax=Paragonimus heterotremus TaxID=100268 RepID=A0A8J4STE0_9TREM|nr:hypothetical protein PHET_01457 [Paragonimus heterotremus]
MTGANVECFLGSYVEALQIIPQQMQTEISSYLQSDLQHQHLLRLSKQYVDELKRATSLVEQKAFAKKLVVCLIAIQDICDKRMPMICDLKNFIEAQTQQLYNLKAKLRTDSSHVCTSGTETNGADETGLVNADESSQADATYGFGTSDSANRKVSCIGIDTDSRRTISVVKGRTRPQVRSDSQPGSVTGTRRLIKRWDNGTHRRKPTSSMIRTHKPNFQPMRQRPLNVQRAGDYSTTEQRLSKSSGVYPRYTRVHHQQRLKKQKQRAISRTFHTNNRAVQLSDPSERHLESNFGPHYLKTGKRLHSKVSRATATSRICDRDEWSNAGHYYLGDCRNEESVSNASSGDGLDNTGSTSNLRNTSSRALDLNLTEMWEKAHGRSSDELDDSENTDETGADSTLLHMREIKQYYGKDPRSRLSSPGAKLVSGHGHQYNPSLRRLSRLRKPTDQDSTVIASNCDRRLSQSSETSGGLTQRTALVASSNTSDKKAVTKRRERNRTRFCEQLREAVRSSPDRVSRNFSTTNQSGSPRPRSSFLSRSPKQSPGRHKSDTSDGTPDERLYCLCKKISFGDMIACDNKDCEVEWFHFACVDIRVQPKGKWYCPLCRGESSKMKRSDV